MTITQNYIRNKELLVAHDFLPPDIIEVLTDPKYNFEPYPGRADYPADEVFPKDTVRAVRALIGRELARHFEISQPLYADYVAASKMTKGMSHARHADSVTRSGTPNHTPWRLVTAMLYLNDMGIEPESESDEYVRDGEFIGGQLVFPNLERVIEPKTNLLVGFRCDQWHTHEVWPVELGVRRAIAVWYSTDPGRERQF